MEHLLLKMSNKKAIITSPADMIKGVGAGFVIGAIVVYLIAKGIIPIPTTWFQFLF